MKKNLPGCPKNFPLTLALSPNGGEGLKMGTL
jgi:hypothetical protein